MKIFITGGTGFIGTNLIKRLAQTSHQLYCLVRETSDTTTIKEVVATIIIGDVMDKNSLLKGMKGCDWVVNLASSYEFWVPNRMVYKEVNIDGMRNVMESILETGISKVVHVSTIAVYGNAVWPITEKSAFGSVRSSQYAQTKYEGDLIAWGLYREKKLPLVVIYPSAVLGPNDPKAAGRYIRNYSLGRMPAQIVTKSIFPFVHVKDVCEAILLALEKKDNIGEKYLVSKCNLTFRELNNMISEISGTKLPMLRLPDWMTIASARFFTGIANLIKKRPVWDMAIEQIKLMKGGLEVKGSKAERELGLKYETIHKALEDAIISFRS